MKSSSSLILTAAGLLAAAASSAAQAYESGDWLVRVGSHYVEPKSDNHAVVNVDGAFGLTGSVVYFLRPTLAVDLLLAYPYSHDINLNGGGQVASTDHLPPTLSLVWYPDVSETWHPYFGAGLNYTMFFDEETEGALAGSKLELDDSFGVAAVAGIDVDLNEHWGISADIRYFDIDADATLDGADLDDVEIDPFGYGLSVRYRF